MGPNLVYIALVMSSSSLSLSQDLALVHSEDSESEASEASVTSERPLVSSDTLFVATEEWQEVWPGQRVPGGLHVRMNLETGKKEAKILTPETDTSQEALKAALKNIKADDVTEETAQTEPDKFRSMAELKEALGDVQLNVETDVELITKLVSQFRVIRDDDDRVTILEDLEYYVHQYDNALLFADLGGVKDIVTPSLNSR